MHIKIVYKGKRFKKETKFIINVNIRDTFSYNSLLYVHFQ